MLAAASVSEFEQANGLLLLTGKSTHRGGRNPTYKWEDMLVDVLISVIHNGLPRTQEEFFIMMLDWFAEHSVNGEVPDASTVRKRFSGVWWQLQEKL